MSNNIAIGFRNADSSAFDKLLNALDFMNAQPFFRDYKSSIREALNIRPNQSVLDVGCGTGADLIDLSGRYLTTHFIGADRSQQFLDIARFRGDRCRNISWILADGLSLPLQAQTIDSARIDRALQHMNAPKQAIAEIVRTVKPGGLIVSADPDWRTFRLQTGNDQVSPFLEEKFRRSIKNPLIGRETALYMESLGLTGVKQKIHTLKSNSLHLAEIVFDLTTVRNECVASGLLLEKDSAEWAAHAEEVSDSSDFCVTLDVIETCGWRP